MFPIQAIQCCIACAVEGKPGPERKHRAGSPAPIFPLKMRRASFAALLVLAQSNPIFGSYRALRSFDAARFQGLLQVKNTLNYLVV